MTRFELSILPSTKKGETFYSIFDTKYMTTALVLTNKTKAVHVLQKANNGDLSMLYELSLKYVK